MKRTFRSYLRYDEPCLTILVSIDSVLKRLDDDKKSLMLVSGLLTAWTDPYLRIAPYIILNIIRLYSCKRQDKFFVYMQAESVLLCRTFFFFF